MNETEVLARLVAFAALPGQPNADIAGWIRNYLAGCGVKAVLLPGPEGDRCNLFATVGPPEVPGIVLSGHMDVVPATETAWTGDPFRLRKEGDRLLARGTTDMKGFLAAVLAAVPGLVARRLKRPLHIAFSYDEEAGCRGVPHLLAALPGLCAPPEGAVIGEPSRMQPVCAHKGKAAIGVEITGRSGHSSRPDLGLNAIHALTPVMAAAIRTAEVLAEGPFDERFEPRFSTLQVGVVAGGSAVNVIPDRAAAEIELRAIPGVQPLDLLAPVTDEVLRQRAGGFDARWTLRSAYPALAGRVDSPLAGLLAGITGHPPVEAVSYGTEAGLYHEAGIPAVICGPGDIGRAHRADEFVTGAELAECGRMLAALADRMAE